MNYRLLQSLMAVTLVVGALNGCGGSPNLTSPLDDPITVAVVNRTPYRAIFTMGAMNQLDENTVPEFLNVRLESQENDPDFLGVDAFVTQRGCYRAAMLGAQELINQIREQARKGLVTVEDEQAMVVGVNFSDAPEGSPDETNPTVGTAEPLTALQGIDYPCGSMVIFTLEEDPEAEGGFRIDVGTVF